MKIKTLTALRSQFWLDHPQYRDQWRARKRQNDYPTDTRVAWCDYIEHLQRAGTITERLAQEATL